MLIDHGFIVLTVRLKACALVTPLWHEKQGKMQSFGDGENSRMNDFGPKHSTPVKSRTYQQQPLPEYASPSSLQAAHKNTSKTTLNKGAPQWASQCKAQEYSDEFSSPDNSPKPTNKASLQHPHHQETKDSSEAGYDRCRSHIMPAAYNTSQNKYNGGTDNDKGYTVLQKQSGTWFVSPKGMYGQISGDGKGMTNMSSVLSDTIAWSPGSTAAFLEQDIINKQRHEMKILMEELGIRDQELNDLVSSHQKQVQAWEAEREKFSTLHSRLRSYEEELIKNDKQLKETLKEMALVSEQREADSLEFKRTQDEMEKLAERISENSHYIKEMEFQNKSLKNTIKELMAEQANKEKREHELLKSIEDKEKLLSEKKVEINQLNDHIKYFESRCEELEEKNVNMASETNTWKRKYCLAKDEADKLVGQNTEKEECNQKMTLQLQESLQQAVALQKALFTSCEREKCKEEVMYSLRKQHKRTMQELQNIRELYDRQNRDLTLYHLSVKERIDKEAAKKESEQVQPEKPENKAGAQLEGGKHLKGDKNMSSHKDRVSSTQESEDSNTYLVKNRCRQEASHEEVTEDADSASYKTEACNRSTHTTRCYNVATTTSSTTQLSEDRDSSIPRSRPSTSLGISKTSTWGSSSIQNSSRYSESRGYRSCSDPRSGRQRRAMRSKTTSPILTRYPFAYRHRPRTRRRSRDNAEARTEESCSSTGSPLLSPLNYDDDLTPADSDGMCQELKRDIKKICVESFDISPSTEKSKPLQGAKPSSMKHLPTAMSNPSRSSFLKKERVEKRISFSADDDEITATLAPSLSKKSLELAARKEQWSSRASLHNEAQGDYMLSPSAIENECSHNSPLDMSCVIDESTYSKQVKHYCETKTHGHGQSRCKSGERTNCHCPAVKKSACNMRPHKPCSDYCKCLGHRISPPSQKRQEQCHCKKTPGESKPPPSDNRPPSQKCLKTLEKNPSNSSSNPKPRGKQPDDDQNLSTNGNPNSPSMEDQDTRNSHSEDPPVKKSLTPNQKKVTQQPDKRVTSSSEPSNATEPQTSSKKSFLETYHPSFHGLRRSIIDFIYPSSENGNNEAEKEKEKSPGQWNFGESENEQSTSQTKSYQSEQDEHSDTKRKFTEQKQSSAHDNSTAIFDRNEVPAANGSIRQEKSRTSDSKSRVSSLPRSGSLITKERKPSSTATSTLLIPPVRDSFSGKRSNEILKERKASDAVVENAHYTELNATEGQVPKKSIYQQEETIYTREVGTEEKLESEIRTQMAEMEEKPAVFFDAGLTYKPDDLEEETITYSDHRQTKRYDDQIVNERKISFAEHKSSIPGYRKASHRDSNTSPFVTMSPTVKGHMSIVEEDDDLGSRQSVNRPSTLFSVPAGRSSQKIISTKGSVNNTPVIMVEEDIVYIEMPPENGQEKKIFSFSNRGVNVPPDSTPYQTSNTTPINTPRLQSNAMPANTPHSGSHAATQANTPHLHSNTTPANTPHSGSHVATQANTPHLRSNTTPANTPHSGSHVATQANTPHLRSYTTPANTPHSGSHAATQANTPHTVNNDAGDVVHENEEDNEEVMTGKVSRAISCNMEKPLENKRTSSFLSYDDKNLNDMPVKTSRAVSCSIGGSSESVKRSAFPPVSGGENLDEMPSRVSRAVSSKAYESNKSEKRGFSLANTEDIPSKMSRAVGCDILESPRTRQLSSKYTYPDKGIDVGLDRMSRQYDDLIDSWSPVHGDITKKRAWKTLSHRTNEDLTYIKSESPKRVQTLKMFKEKSPIMEISPGRRVDCSPHREKVKSRGSPPLSGFFLKKNKKMKITVQYSDDECKDSSDESCMPETSFSVQDDSDDFPERPCSSCKRDKHRRCRCHTSHFLKNKPDLSKHHGIYSCKDKGARPERDFGYSDRMLRSCGKTSPIKEEHFSFQKIFQRNMSDSFWGQPKSLCGLLSSPKDKDFFESGTGFPSSKYKGSKVDPFIGQPMYSGKGGASYLPSDVGVYLSRNRKLYCNNNKSLEVHCEGGPDEPSGSGPMIDKLDLGTGVEFGPNTSNNSEEVIVENSGHTVGSTNGSDVLDGMDGPSQHVEDKETERNYFYTEATSSTRSLVKVVITEEAKTVPGKAQPSKPFTTFRGPSLYKHLSQIHFSEKSNRYEWVDGTEKSMNGCINLVSASRPPSILPESRKDSENVQGSHFELWAGSEKCDRSLDSGHHSLSGGFLEGIAVGSSSNINNNNVKLSDDSCVDSPAASDLFTCQPPADGKEIHASGSLHRRGRHPFLDPVVRKLNFEDTSSLAGDLASPVLDRTFRLDQKGNDESESGCGHDGKKQRSGIPYSCCAMPPLDCVSCKSTNIQNEPGTSPTHLQCDTKSHTANVNSSEISEADHPSLADYFKDISTLVVDDSDEEKSILVNAGADDILNVEVKGCIDTTDSAPEAHNKTEVKLMSNLARELPAHEMFMLPTQAGKYEILKDRLLGGDQYENFQGNHGNLVFHKWPEIQVNVVDGRPVANKNVSVKLSVDNHQKIFHINCHEKTLLEKGFDLDLKKHLAVLSFRENEVRESKFVQSEPSTQFVKSPEGPRMSKLQSVLSQNDLASLLEATSICQSSAANDIITAGPWQDTGTKVPDWLEEEIAELPDNLFGKEPPSTMRREPTEASSSIWKDHLRPQISPSTRLHKLLIQSQQMIHLLEHSSAIPETIKLEVSMSYKS